MIPSPESHPGSQHIFKLSISPKLVKIQDSQLFVSSLKLFMSSFKLNGDDVICIGLQSHTEHSFRDGEIQSSSVSV